MCFDVPKVVQIPGYDHGHDEESRNGRDIKIDTLEAYVWISVEYVGANMGIQVPLLVIDHRGVSVMSP